MSNARNIATLSTVEVGATADQTKADLNAIGVSGGRKNLIMNGGMQIAQRGSTWTTSNGSLYTLDRWRAYENATGNITVSHETDSPDDFSSSLKVLVETADASISASEQVKVHQKIEAYNTAHLGFGTSSAKAITISFWVKSSLTGTFGCVVSNHNESRCYVKEYTINSANTWEKKALTVSGDTSGTWENNSNTVSLQVIWSMGTGTDRESAADTWHSSSEFQTSNCTNLIGTAGATWQITGVQLELGSVATDFEHRSYGEELALCQRYYVNNFNSGLYPGQTGVAMNGGALAQRFNLTDRYVVLGEQYPVPMRASPSLSIYDRRGNINQMSQYNSSTTVVTVSGVSQGLSTTTVALYLDNNSGSGTDLPQMFHYTADAEL